jgi:hypothetical protein
VFVDNKSAIRIAKNPKVLKTNCHFDFSYHFIRENVDEFKQNRLESINTADNEADIMTKALKPERFRFLSRKLVGNVENVEEYLLRNIFYLLLTLKMSLSHFIIYLLIYHALTIYQ